MEDLVSIVIPCYNAENFISETLSSILRQDHTNFEILIIDDGSTDKSAAIIGKIDDKRISYHYQKNAGVSNARNNGIPLAKGKYIIFFDADDVMSDKFLSSRITELKKSDLKFVAGKILHYNGKSISKTDFFFPKSETLQRDILIFNYEINTCPSNVMLVTSFVRENKLHFNENLSSTADRYFLMECSLKGSGYYSENVSPLIYRISDTSMSNQLSLKLVHDNEIFFKELKSNKLVPDELLPAFNKKMLRILSGAHFKLHNYRKSIVYGFRYLIS